MITHNPPTAEQIQAARESANLSQVELAGKLLGYSDADIRKARKLKALARTVHRWETGGASPDRDNTNRLHALLGFTESSE